MTDHHGMFDPMPARGTVNGHAPVAAGASGWVSSVPDDAPPVPPLRGSTRWWYRDATGGLSFAVDRYEPRGQNDRKQFVPLALWREHGRLVWKKKHPPNPRPLYGLDQLAARSEAPVLVVEGEKSADAAGTLFPEHVAITSPGGSNAAGKADWSPLAGRTVTIWPDADSSGRKFADDVARLCSEVGAAEVRSVSLPVGLPCGWDLADEIPDGLDINALLRDAVLVCKGSAGSADPKSRKKPGKTRNSEGDDAGFRPGSAGSNWLPKGFRKRADDAIEVEIDDEWRWLCSPLVVEAATRNTDGEAWGRLIRVRDRDGGWHEWAMPMAELAASGDGYRARLLSMGLEMASGGTARNALHRLLTAADPQARARCVATLGWHGGTFMLPDAVLGQAAGERFVLQTASPLTHAFRVKGSLQGWQEGVAKPAAGNSRLVFATSMAFAAPLLTPLGIEGGGVHFRGPSSTGKTTLGEVAGSACGGGRDGYKTTWRATDNGIETVAAIHNDGLAVLDEIGQVNSEALGPIAYMLANGQAKRRMARDGQARSTATWRLLFLSTGEVGLADKLRESRRGGVRVMAGQQVRVLDLPADAGTGHGVFDELAGHANGQALADHLKTAAAASYGHALRAFLARLVAEPWQERAQAFINAFVAEATPTAADGQVRRAAQRFAVIAAGGELAQRWGIVPWAEGVAMAAAVRLFGEWLKQRGGSEPAEISAGLAAVRHFLELHGASRFVPWDDPARVVQNRVGFTRETDSGTSYYVTPEAWRNDILAGHDAATIAREMVRRKLLKTNDDGKPATKQRLPNSEQRKVYVVLPTIFGEEGP